MSNTSDKIFQPLAETQEVCKHCRYFREKDESLGYCNCHHVYVLKSFDCQKYLLKEEEAEGGGVCEE